MNEGQSLFQKFESIQNNLGTQKQRVKTEDELLKELEEIRDDMVSEASIEAVEVIDWKSFVQNEKRTYYTENDEVIEKIESRVKEHFFAINSRYYIQRPTQLTNNDMQWATEICRWLENIGKLFKSKTISEMLIELNFSRESNQFNISFLMPKHYAKTVEAIKRLKLDKKHYDPIIKSNFQLNWRKNSFDHDVFELTIESSAPPRKPVPPPKRVAKPRIVI